jgi:apolipoprotein N-acyltransferase
MRALELGKPVIRGTNNGITAITDHRGTVIAQLPQFTTDVLRAEAVSTAGATPYRNIGNTSSWIFLSIALLLGLNSRRLNSKA